MSHDPENPTPRDAASDTPAAAAPETPADALPAEDDGARDGTPDFELPAPEARETPGTAGAAEGAAPADTAPAHVEPTDAVPPADAGEGTKVLEPVAPVPPAAPEAVRPVDLAATPTEAPADAAPADAASAATEPVVEGDTKVSGPVAPEPVRPVDGAATAAGAHDGAPGPAPAAGVPGPRGPWAPPVPPAPGHGGPAVPAGYNPWAPPLASQDLLTKRPVPEGAPAPQPQQPHDPWAPPAPDASATVPPQPPHATWPGHPGQPGYPGQPAYPAYPGYPSYPGDPYGGWMPPTARNGLGLTAMILGIVGAVLGISCFGAFLGLPLGIGAVICGIAGLRIVKRGEATNRPQAMTGLILGIVSVVLSGVMIALLVGGIAGGWFEGSGDNLIRSRNGGWDEPLDARGTAFYDDGVQVMLLAPRQAAGIPAGVVGEGTAVSFTVEVVNTGDDRADLSESEISAYGEDSDDDSLQDLSQGKGLPDTLDAGERTTAEVTVVVPDDDEDGSFQVEVAPGFDYDYTYWQLDVP